MAQQATHVQIDPALEDALEHHRTSTGQSHRKLLMWTFLGSDCMFFGALIATFLVYQNNPGDGPPRQEVLSNLMLVSIMAFALLLSSFTMVLGLSAARRGDERGMRLWLLVTAFFGLFFIASQGFEFFQFVRVDGLTPKTSPFGASFMTLTGFHGAHVTVGIIILVSLAFMARLDPKAKAPAYATILPGFLRWLSGVPRRPQDKPLEARPRHRRFLAFVRRQIEAPPPAPPVITSLDEFETERVREDRILNIEIAGLYWHFVDVVWVVIFTVVYLFTGKLEGVANGG